MRTATALAAVAWGVIIGTGMVVTGGDRQPEAEVAAAAEELPPIAFEDFQRRVYALFLCSAGTDWATGKQGWGLAEDGYKGFDAKYVGPLVEAGVARIHLHLPDGFFEPGKMPFDARVDASEHGYTGADDLKWLYAKHPGVVWLHYFGTLDDRDMQRRLRDGDYAAWLYRARRSVLHTLDLTNVEYGFDESTKWPEESVQWRWLQLLRSVKREQGRDCLLESVLQADQPHTHGWGVLAIRSWFEAVQDHPEWTWDLPIDQYAPGQRVHIMDVAHGGASDVLEKTVPQAVADVLSMGPDYTVAIRLDVYVSSGYTMRDLYSQTTERMR